MVRHPIKNRDDENRDYEQLKKQLQEVYSRSQEITRQLHDLYEEAGFTPEQVSAYLDNPENFTQEQWETLQKHRESIQKFIWDAVGYDKKAEYEKAESKTKEKKRRRKTLGSRRRGWIKMD